MLNIYFYIQSALRNDRGATAVEYGIMVAAIAAVIIAVVVTLGGQVESAFEDVSGTLTTELGYGAGS